MFGISGEHLLVLLVILLIFGPKRLPDLGHSIGRTLKNFKDGLSSHAAEQDRAADRAAETRALEAQRERERQTTPPMADPANTTTSALASAESPVSAPAGSDKV